jgi:hypothetical protein
LLQTEYLALPEIQDTQYIAFYTEIKGMHGIKQERAERESTTEK